MCSAQNDHWNYSQVKLPKSPPIELPELHGVLPFRGIRNPSGRSSYSHKIFFTYKTPASNFTPEVGIAESAIELAVAYEALISPDLYDLKLQPFASQYLDPCEPDPKKALKSITHDILVTFNDMKRRVVYVRNGHSLSKPETQIRLKAIRDSVLSKGEADDFYVANGDDYPKIYRNNLSNMHRFISNPNPDHDEMVFDACKKLRTLWVIKDIFERCPLREGDILKSCYRLVAQEKLRVNKYHVISPYSRIEVA